MQEQELLYLLALKNVNGLGDQSIQKMVTNIGSAKKAFESPVKVLQNIPNINSNILRNINQEVNLIEAQKEIDLIQKHQIKISVWNDDSYPIRLKRIPDSPCILRYKGKFDTHPQKIISIVGTRKITAYGKDYLKEFFKEISRYNPVIVSGLAYGVDALAHQLALDNNLITYGVVAHGLYRIYPALHKTLANQMVKNNGCILTECSFHAIADKENFPKRNRIIAGLSDVTLVIESDIKGGSMITARLANGYNRDVMALPGAINARQSKGCNFLIKNNEAHMMTEPGDLIRLMNWGETKNEPVQKQLFVDLNSDEQKLLAIFEHGSQLSIDQIAGHLNLPNSHVSVQLLGLEMKGVITSLPGSRYKLN